MNKNKTISELIDEARRQSGEPELAGHDIMALERFDTDVTLDVLSHSSPVGNKGERMRLFLQRLKLVILQRRNLLMILILYLLFSGQIKRIKQ